MAYEFRLAVVDDVSKQMKRMQKSMDGMLDIVKDLQDNMDELPGSVKRVGNETEKTEKKAKGLLREVNSINKTMRRTTALFGAAFGLGQISQFTNEVIDSEQQIANLFGVTGNELKTLNSDATKLATVYRVDVTEGIEAANSISKQFGITGAESFSLIEQALAKGVSKEFLGSVEELAPAFREAGLSADSMFALLAQGQRAGVGDELAKSYAEGIERLGSLSGEGTLDALGLLGLDPNAIRKGLEGGGIEVADVMKVAVDAIQKLGPESVAAKQAIKGLFGESAESLQGNIGLLSQIPMSLSAVEDRTTDATRAQQYLFGAWADFKILIAENVVPVLVDVVSWVKENQDSLLYWGGIIARTAVLFGGIWLAAKSFLVIKSMVSTVTTAFSAFNAVIKLAQMAQIALNIAMTANPIGLVVAAIAGIGVAVYAMITYWEDFKNYIWGVAQWMWDNNPISWMIYAVDYIFPGFKAAMQTLWNWTGKAAKGMWDGFVNWFVGPIKTAFEWISWWFGDSEKKANKLNKNVQDTKATAAGEGGPGLSIFKEVGGILNEATKGVGAIEDMKVVPGMENKGLNFAGQMKQPKGTGNLGISAGIAGVQSEGPKAQNLTININKLVESLNINTTTLKEGAGRIKEEIAKALLAAVNDVNASIG